MAYVHSGYQVAEIRKRAWEIKERESRDSQMNELKILD